jgi:hypothetical protein
MSSVTIEVDLPDDWTRFSLPPALDARLTALLDQQDQSGGLAEAEQGEADALCELVDMLTLLKLRAERASRK